MIAIFPNFSLKLDALLGHFDRAKRFVICKVPNLAKTMALLDFCPGRQCSRLAAMRSSRSIVLSSSVGLTN